MKKPMATRGTPTRHLSRVVITRSTTPRVRCDRIDPDRAKELAAALPSWKTEEVKND